MTSRIVAALAASSLEFLPPMPALWTKCVIGPSARVASSNTRSMSASTPMSPCSATALPPDFFTASTTLGRGLGVASCS